MGELKDGISGGQDHETIQLLVTGGRELGNKMDLVLFCWGKGCRPISDDNFKKGSRARYIYDVHSENTSKLKLSLSENTQRLIFTRFSRFVQMSLTPLNP